MTSRTIPALAAACVTALTAATAGQAQSYARVVRSAGEAVMSVLGPRPLDAAATLLASEFGLQVNVEDPLYFGRDDEDATRQESRPVSRQPAVTGAAAVLERRFELDAAGFPRDVRQLLRDAVNEANAQAPSPTGSIQQAKHSRSWRHARETGRAAPSSSRRSWIVA
jgi:hypothetical protein